MRIITREGVYGLESGFHEKAFPKDAGFRWHGPDCRKPCKPCNVGMPFKMWWTDDSDKVGRLHRKVTEAGLVLEIADEVLAERAKAASTAEAVALAASRATDATIEIPIPDGLALLGYQRAGVAFALQTLSQGRGVLLADEMGLGKTVQLIATVNAILAGKTAEEIASFSALIMCPATLKGNWRREFDRWCTAKLRTYVVTSGHTPPGWANVVICNYDRLVGAHGAGLLAALMARPWNLIGVDEAHFLKNPKSQRTIAVFGSKGAKEKGTPGKKGYKAAMPPCEGLAHHAKAKMYLTGTPILNKPIEAHPLLSSLDPDTFGDFFSYARKYCYAKKEIIPGGRTIWNFNGSSNLGQLQELLRTRVMVRRLKADVLTELPAKLRQIVVIEADSDKVRALIDRQNQLEGRAPTAKVERLEADRALAHAAGDTAAWARAVAALDAADAEEPDYDDADLDHGAPRRASGPAFTEVAKLRHDIAVAKVPGAIDHVDGMLADGVDKVVIFAHHHDVITPLLKHYGDEAVAITGKTPMEERQGIVDRFQSDPTVKVFVGNYQAAGVGITLTAASRVVCVEQQQRPADMTQAEDRCHRIGQRDSVLVQHLVLEDSYDAHVAAELVRKQAIADNALDNTAATAILAAPVKPRLRPIAMNAEPGMEGAEAPPPPKYPAATDEQRDLCGVAIRIIAGKCDGAAQLDGNGFSKIDAHVGHSLADRVRPYTDGEVWLAMKLARKYRRQLPASLVTALGVGEKKVAA